MHVGVRVGGNGDLGQLHVYQANNYAICECIIAGKVELTLVHAPYFASNNCVLARSTVVEKAEVSVAQG